MCAQDVSVNQLDTDDGTIFVQSFYIVTQVALNIETCQHHMQRKYADGNFPTFCISCISKQQIPGLAMTIKADSTH